MLLLAILFASTSPSVPWITALSRARCCSSIDAWIALGDERLQEEWKRSRALYVPRMVVGRALGCVGVCEGDRVLAVALLERTRQKNIIVWDVSCVDHVSGTKLVKTMCRISPDARVGATLAPRWRIAFAYHKAST